MNDRLRVRVWSDEPPGNHGYKIIAMRRAGNDGFYSARVSITARGDLMGWKWMAEPTHWLPDIPTGASMKRAKP